MPRRLRSAALALAAIAAPAPALAHAHLLSASPAPDARLTSPPAEVRLVFSESLEPAFSSFTVQGPAGFRGMGPAKTAGDRRTLSAAPKAPLPPGRYVVRWKAMAADSHHAQGTFSFQVGR
jgi:methionine-rich copper-binding protein CopC